MKRAKAASHSLAWILGDLRCEIYYRSARIGSQRVLENFSFADHGDFPLIFRLISR